MFDEMLTIEKLISYYDDDNFAFIVFESSNEFLMDLILATKMSMMHHLKF
jgi:hypothetical protein